MSTRLRNGIVAGLMAGIPFGVAMQMMSAPTPDGGAIPMMIMVAMVVRSQSVVIGWTYHLFNSAVIGAIFAGLLGRRAQTYAGSLVWGSLYGIAWWVLGGLVLMPLLLGMPAFAPLAMADMRSVAIGSLVGHVMYGLILGLAYVWLEARQAAPAHSHGPDSPAHSH
ncbi:MAG: hypothetical protein WD040_07245 [Anaerolineales bacterium]